MTKRIKKIVRHNARATRNMAGAKVEDRIGPAPKTLADANAVLAKRQSEANLDNVLDAIAIRNPQAMMELEAVIAGMRKQAKGRKSK